MPPGASVSTTSRPSSPSAVAGSASRNGVRERRIAGRFPQLPPTTRWWLSSPPPLPALVHSSISRHRVGSGALGPSNRSTNTRLGTSARSSGGVAGVPVVVAGSERWPKASTARTSTRWATPLSRPANSTDGSATSRVWSSASAAPHRTW